MRPSSAGAFRVRRRAGRPGWRQRPRLAAPSSVDRRVNGWVAGCYRRSEPIVSLDPEQGPEHDGGDDEAADPVDEERVPARDVVHEEAEVLAEEAGDQGPDDEQGADHG